MDPERARMANQLRLLRSRHQQLGGRKGAGPLTAHFQPVQQERDSAAGPGPKLELLRGKKSTARASENEPRVEAAPPSYRETRSSRTCTCTLTSIMSSSGSELSLSAYQTTSLTRTTSGSTRSRSSSVALDVRATAPVDRYKEYIVWQCKHCPDECVPVRDESRCLCGHRLKQHDKGSSNGKRGCQCGNCRCQDFKFIFASGRFVLRCSCKHKHIDHDPVSHSCTKESCGCSKFFSPFVCNCTHAWADHEQRVERRRSRAVDEMLAQSASELSELCIGGDNVKRTDLYEEPLMLN